jgi:hypothetical protein
MLTHPQEAISQSFGEAENRHPAARIRGMLSRPETEDMWKYMLIGALTAGGAILVYQNLPDIIRYLKMRSI